MVSCVQRKIERGWVLGMGWVGQEKMHSRPLETA